MVSKTKKGCARLAVQNADQAVTYRPDDGGGVAKIPGGVKDSHAGAAGMDGEGGAEAPLERLEQVALALDHTAVVLCIGARVVQDARWRVDGRRAIGDPRSRSHEDAMQQERAAPRQHQTVERVMMNAPRLARTLQRQLQLGVRLERLLPFGRDFHIHRARGHRVDQKEPSEVVPDARRKAVGDVVLRLEDAMGAAIRVVHERVLSQQVELRREL